MGIKKLKQLTKAELIEQVGTQQNKNAELFHRVCVEKKRADDAEKRAFAAMEQQSVIIDAIFSSLVKQYGAIEIEMPDITKFKPVQTMKVDKDGKTYYHIEYAPKKA